MNAIISNGDYRYRTSMNTAILQVLKGTRTVIRISRTARSTEMRMANRTWLQILTNQDLRSKNKEDPTTGYSGSGRSTLSRKICEQRQLPMKQVYLAEYGMGGTPPTSGSTRCISTDGAPLIRCSCAVLRIYYQKSRDNKRSSVSLLFELLLSLHRYLLRSFSN